METTLKSQSFCSGKLLCRGTILWNTATRSAVLIDPTDDATPFLEFILKMNLEVKALLLTHAHVDHAASVCEVAKTLHLIPQMHPADIPLYQNMHRHGISYGIRIAPLDIIPSPLEQGQLLQIEPDFLIRVLHVPGHTPGCVTFYIPALNLAIVGDTLFRESVGRTDLPGGNQKDLFHSIQTILYQLPAETTAVPGHGPLTTIGHEMRQNPYVKAL